MQRTVIIYESEYGTTEKTAKYLSLILGPAIYCKTTEFKDEYKDFDFIIIGSPVYSGKFLTKITEFINENISWLNEKNIALFSISLSIKDGIENLMEIEKLMKNVVSKKALGGKLELNKLNKKDSDALKIFSKQLGMEMGDVNNFNLEDVVNYALQLKALKENLIAKYSSDDLESEIEEFLSNHNTCTLSTSFKERVRSTPIEYNYFNGYIYLLSEGGEKFANILLNNNVSLAVYEDYTTMNNLAGMQITGKASIIENKEEYREIIEKKGLNPEFIERMPVNMNILKIKIEKIEFLYSKFKKMGYEPKQILEFD
ncbi:MAG: pyridoxamine 5'-phosphate oxidase family protein [Methanobacterium sp.]|nr:pyridoxamine 5'-phosphate oxidase family protein [Methanobacterium sp.]